MFNLSTLFTLAYKSARNRWLTTLLTMASMSLSVFLLLGIEQIHRGTRDSFSQTISQTDLIVGARNGPVTLLLYTVFQLGQATNNISIESFQYFSKHQAVAWTVPISLGDSHKGFRVVATTDEFLKYYRHHGDKKIELSEGTWSAHSLQKVIIGSDVAKVLKYKIGQEIVVAHGMSTADTALQEHSDQPFTVEGILKPSGTPYDRVVFISLESMEAIHIGWGKSEEERATLLKTSAANINELQPKVITAFLLGAKSKIDVLRLKREINDYSEEPLLGLIPGVTLNELWRTVGIAESALKLVAKFVLLVSFLGLLVALYTTLQERRREMAILRALGASTWQIAFLFLLETWLLSLSAIVIGMTLTFAALGIGNSFLLEMTGVSIPLQPLGLEDLFNLALIFLGATLTGLIVGWKALKNSLADGLQIRV